MPSRAACPHCNTAFTPDAGAQLDDCPTCGRAVEIQLTRCPHCGYTPDAIPSDSDAYAQANCEHRESHGKTVPAPRKFDLVRIKTNAETALQVGTHLWVTILAQDTLTLIEVIDNLHAALSRNGIESDHDGKEVRYDW